MNEKDKIKQYLEYKGISKNRFYNQTGLSVGFLDSGKSLGVDKAKIIINKFPDLSLEWLVMDKGNMLNTEDTQLSGVNIAEQFPLRTDRTLDLQSVAHGLLVRRTGNVLHALLAYLQREAHLILAGRALLHFVFDTTAHHREQRYDKQ